MAAIIAKKKFKHIVCIADGARDLWRYFRRKYPDAIHVVDFFSMSVNISQNFPICFSKAAQAQSWYKKYRTILKEDPKGASKVIRAARYRRSLIKENPEIETEIKYLQHK